jgi:hypothetical protein
MALTELAWAWVNGADGVKMAGAGSLGPGPFLVSTGRYDFTTQVGTLVAAQANFLTKAGLNNFGVAFQVAIVGGVAQVKALDATETVQSTDLLIRLFGEAP